ncbi:MAG: ABC transporter substrate-binding protein [Acidobacteria bacterium]|nr:ABC transporter substrate-binding protein [Acidobacteriota bacterium]
MTIALTEKFSGLDTLSNTSTDAAADRLRTLLYNSLIKKGDKFDYVGEIGDYKVGDDNLTITYTLRDNIKFHNGKVMTSADVKYTFDALFQANGAKAGSFYDSVPDETDPEKKKTKRVAHISSLETPDPKTVVFKVTRPELVNQLLSNLVTIPIIPEGTIEQQKTAPVGSGPFKFVSFDQVNSLVKLEAFNDYWEGGPKIQKLNVKTVPDPSALQSELMAGTVDISPNPTILSPDALKAIGDSGQLKVERFPGSNIQYIGFNTQVSPFNNVKVRQAIAYAIDRDNIVQNLFNGQAKIAYSILPEDSWAYSAGTKYNYDPAKAQQLLQEAGYKGEVVKFKYASGNQAVNQYAQLIQNSLKKIGFNIELETLETLSLTESLKSGQFQMSTGIWIGGNQDPIFYRDLFASTDFPEKKLNGRNRARYSNPEFDKVIDEAVKTVDKAKAKELYAKAQEIISNDVPLLPLWYPTSMVISTKRIGNVKINPSGDWGFVKDLTVTN